MGIGTWTKIGLNNTDYNYQVAFNAANSRFVAPADGTYPLAAILEVDETAPCIAEGASAGCVTVGRC